MLRKNKNLFLSIVAIICAACANNTPRLNAPILAPDFVQQINRVEPLPIKTIARNTKPNHPLRVYIEGDGFAWATRRRPSTDPTPRNQLVMHLMAQDQSTNLAYMARPCQFTKQHSAACHNNDWWTNKRFHQDAITAMSRALDELKTSPAQKLELIGFSGGGAMAALLTAERNDVTLLVTIAGNLDVAAVNKHHKVSAMPLSENPIQRAAQVKHIPQVHFYGSDDRVIPPFISQRFIEAQNTQCAKRIAVPATHNQGWLKAWPSLQTQIVKNLHNSLCHED